MTDKSAAAIREFVEKWAQEWSEITGWYKSQTMYDYMLSDLTALISEHYVAKEEVDKMVSERLREELIAYDHWVASQEWGRYLDGESEKYVNEYLKSIGR